MGFFISSLPSHLAERNWFVGNGNNPWLYEGEDGSERIYSDI